MTADIEHLILEHLKAIRASQNTMALDVADLKARVQAVASHAAAIVASMAAHNLKLDHLEERIGRVERRLELAG